MAPKTHMVIHYAKHGKPYVLHYLSKEVAVSTPQGGEMAQRVRERDKKRRLSCNGTDKGSKFALARKGADLSHGISWQEMEVNL